MGGTAESFQAFRPITGAEGFLSKTGENKPDFKHLGHDITDSRRCIIMSSYGYKYL